MYLTTFITRTSINSPKSIESSIRTFFPDALGSTYKRRTQIANRIVQTDYAPAAIGPYSQGAFTQIALYCSGQLGIDPATGKLADGIEEQATQAFKNLRAVITEAGLTMADIVKVTIFLTDMANFDAVNKAMKTFVPAPFPARSCFAVAALPKGGLVEIEAIVDRIGQPF